MRNQRAKALNNSPSTRISQYLCAQFLACCALAHAPSIIEIVALLLLCCCFAVALLLSVVTFLSSTCSSAVFFQSSDCLFLVFSLHLLTT